MMKSMKMTAMVLGLTLAGSAFTCSEDGTGGILPENNMRIPVGVKRAGGIDEKQFHNAIDRVVKVYEPIVANLGGNLVTEKRWSDATVNAYAQQSGKTWKISMFGGLARHESITEDGMSLVVCHEIGHHIGGAPKKGGSAGGGGWWGGAGGSSWATNEGQADYFANLKCLRKTFLNENNIAVVAKMTVPAYVSEACSKSTKGDKEDTAICIRGAMAGKSVSNLFSSLGKSPETKFETPDRSVVKATNDSHPAAQCRLDTYFQGSLCDVSFNEDVSQTDEVKGTCHASLGMTSGLRPLCWFKPSKKR